MKRIFESVDIHKIYREATSPFFPSVPQVTIAATPTIHEAPPVPSSTVRRYRYPNGDEYTGEWRGNRTRAFLKAEGIRLGMGVSAQVVPEPPLPFYSHRTPLISTYKGSMADLASCLFGHRLGLFCEAEPWARSTGRGRRCMPGATGTRATGRTTRRWTPPCGYPSYFCHWKRRGSIPRKSADDAPCDVTTGAVCVVISILIPHITSGVSRLGHVSVVHYPETQLDPWVSQDGHGTFTFEPGTTYTGILLRTSPSFFLIATYLFPDATSHIFS